jgi:hypothetical protein
MSGKDMAERVARLEVWVEVVMRTLRVPLGVVRGHLDLT